MTSEVGVGLVGFGTIGTGVAKVIRNNANIISKRLGFPIRLVRVADLDTERDRGVDLSGVQFDDDAIGLIKDPKVSIVVELIGGYGDAKRLILEAIENNKHVVTANKALLALHGDEIFRCAQRKSVDVAFEASVGGGIPILRSIREGLNANRIESLLGIMNGTTNYVLTEMERTGEAFSDVLARAQELGYAETDPSFDIDGIDAAHKLTLLVKMAFGARLTSEQIPTEGIRNLTPFDFEAAKSLGYRIKLLGIARLKVDNSSEKIDVRVHPAMIHENNLLAKVEGPMNAIEVQGDMVGSTLFYGAGAGELPTASAVVADVMDIARSVKEGVSGRVPPFSFPNESLSPKSLVSLSEIYGRCYLIFQADDRSGVLAKITNVLGEHGISIQSVIQQGRGQDSVPVVLLTHPAKEGFVREALKTIDLLDELRLPSRLIRVEEGL